MAMLSLPTGPLVAMTKAWSAFKAALSLSTSNYSTERWFFSPQQQPIVNDRIIYQIQWAHRETLTPDPLRVIH